MEDLWSVSFLTIWRTGSSLLFFLNLADLYTRSRYHFFVSICSICFLATLLSIIFWVQTEDFIFLYGCKKGLFFSIWVLQISYPLPSLWVLLVLVKFSWSWILAILKITLLINCQRECLVLFRQDMVGMGGEINFDTYFATQQTMTSTYVILGQHVLDAWRSYCFSWDLKHDHSVFNSFL